MRKLTRNITFVVTSFLSLNAWTNEVVTIETHKAPFFLNKDVVACGYVAQTKNFKKGLYLNFDKPYPNQSITAVLWNTALPSITQRLGHSLANKNFCVKGKITNYKGSPQISINDSANIW